MTTTTRRPNRAQRKALRAARGVEAQARRFARHYFTSPSVARRCLPAADREWPKAYKLLLADVRAGRARVDKAAILRKLARLG